jgi:hypothetical protein
MTSSTRPSSLQQPLTSWSHLALKTGEMLVASAQVIGHRTGRMVLAGPLPSERDRKEFTLMGQEKVEAAMQSAFDMSRQWMALGGGLGLRMWSDWLAATNAALALAASRTAAESVQRQLELAHTVTRSAASIAQLGHAGARIADRGLKPIHAAATANAKRLARG